MSNCGCPPPYENSDPEDGCGSKKYIKSNIYKENDFDNTYEILSIIILTIIILDFAINIISNQY